MASSIAIEEQAIDPSRRLTFYPFAYALINDHLSNYCWYCVSPLKEKARCTGCQVAYFCSKECHILGWKDHKAECVAIGRTGLIPGIEARLLGRIMVRYKDIQRKKDAKIDHFYKDRVSERKIMDIVAHTEEMKKDPRAMRKFDEIYKDIVEFYDEKHMLPKETVFELHCRNYINRHAISDKPYTREIGKGLYLDLCAYDHSCRPNTIYTCTGFVATLRSLDLGNDIRNRETTFYTYIDLLSSQPERLKQLKDTWYFDCKCDRCLDPKDHQLTGIKCPHCPEDNPTSLSIFGTHDYKDKQTAIITCPKCKSEISRQTVFDGIDIMKFINKISEDNEIEQMPQRTKIEFLEDLLERAQGMLPPENVYLCNIIQKMIPLVDPKNQRELLRLHLISEPCVRFCYPPLHPGIAFHLRSIAVFYSGLKDYENFYKYITESIDILHAVLDDDHPMTIETQRIFADTARASESWIMEPTKDPFSSDTPESSQPSKKACVDIKPTSSNNSKTEIKSKWKPAGYFDVPFDEATALEAQRLAELGQGTSAAAAADLFSEDTHDMPELLA